MLAWAIGLGPARPGGQRWLLGKRSALQFASIVILALASLALSAFVGERNFKLAEQECEIMAQGMMMREVDHRVRNSLGLVYNLMTFQQRHAGNTEATRELLAEIANQVLVVARLHERLYKSGAPDRLRIGQYLRELCDDIGAYSLPEASRAAIRVQAVETDLPAEQAVWLGLIVVEFVTNALKYANPSVQAPVQVAALLVRQLRGTLGIDRAWAGARFIVTVPITATRARG
jgi:signal transduction histidine kinase